jgi:hypothetical protein
MLFGETVAVYCEDHMGHINALRVSKMESSLMLKQVIHIVATVV